MKTYRKKWFEFTTGWSGFIIKYHVAGYFDSRAMLQIYLIWGKLFIYLPYNHLKKIYDTNIKEDRRYKLNKISGLKRKRKIKKVFYDESSPPMYGITINKNATIIYYGKNSKYLEWPWSLVWIRRSALRKDGGWEHERKIAHAEFFDFNKWKDILYYENHEYTYITKMNIVKKCNANIRVQEMEWRWKWFQNFKYPRRIRKTIEVNFNKGIGENKGGTIGCSYDMRPKETAYQTLKRMEKERKF